ncbi:hypothetical protein P3X46_033954 [Hevea brasiliensis]|uniref:Phytocyanin domain-containing protein n=1 Tax=Hevea brasiliensis TaxID=3981 RepID=A0ABQ9KBC4_HEVBR|nr:mavicyanin-like [Hevea brasiliensis]KAJ9129248.1 hypothetical protein P3X46_033954 [Hevea brasiliensis]
MAAAKTWVALVLVVSMSLGGKWVGAQVHHVVGEDRGWDPSTDVASWSSGKTFRVGDKIWFAYSAAHGRIAELKTKEEFESCNINNPIKIYEDGIFSIMLEGEGIRYFVSSNSESCKKGLKLPVEVMPHKPHDTPKVATSESAALGLATGPTPSGSAHLRARFVLLVAGYWLLYMFI